MIPPHCLSITGLHRKPHCSSVGVLAVLTDCSQPRPHETVSEFPLSVPPSSPLSLTAKGLLSLDYVKGSSSCEPVRVAPAVSAINPTGPCSLSCRGDPQGNGIDRKGAWLGRQLLPSCSFRELQPQGMELHRLSGLILPNP